MLRFKHYVIISFLSGVYTNFFKTMTVADTTYTQINVFIDC